MCATVELARLVVRRVKDARYPDALFPVWRHHPFVTNSELPVAEADITHRRHATIETTFADLIDGPLAHIPSGLFAANCAWLACAMITHNLLRAAGTLAAAITPWPVAPPCAATWSTCPPASPPRPANRCCTCQPTGPGKPDGKPCGTTSSAPATRPPNPAPPDPTDQSLSTPPSQARPRNLATRKSWYRPADHACATAPHPAAVQGNRVDDHTKSPIHGFRLRERSVVNLPQRQSV